MEQNFKLWLEFEEVDPNSWDIENEFCNIRVDLEDGRHYGINVWTYKFLQTAVDEDKKNRTKFTRTLSKASRLIRKGINKRMYSTDN